MSCPNGLPGQPSFTQYFHRAGAYSPPCVLSSIFSHSNTARLAAQRRRRALILGHSFRRPTYDAVSINWILHIWTVPLEIAEYSATTAFIASITASECPCSSGPEFQSKKVDEAADRRGRHAARPKDRVHNAARQRPIREDDFPHAGRDLIHDNVDVNPAEVKDVVMSVTLDGLVRTPSIVDDRRIRRMLADDLEGE